MKKRVLSLLMALVMLVSVLPAMGASAAKGQKFVDVYRGHWFANYVYPVSEAGIINGTDNTHYQPESPMLRCDFITLLACSVKDKTQFDSYDGLELCPDSNGKWYSKFVNWAAQEGVIAQGENFRPSDKITRLEAVELMYSLHNSHPEAAPMEPKHDAPKEFSDTSALTAEQKEALDACNMAGIIDGNDKGQFLPNDGLKRSETAKVICDMRGLTKWENSQIPEKPQSAFVEPIVGSKSGARYVEFDPQHFNSKIALANGRLDSAAPAASILKGQGAYIAVNGAMFETDGTSRTWGSFVSGGKVLRIQRPDMANVKREPALVIDTNGKASIQWMNINQSIVRVSAADGSETKAIESVGVNSAVGNNDGSRMVYTSEYASKVSGKVAYAFAVDGNDTITKVYQSASDVPVPKGGYVLFTRKARDPWTDRYFTLAQPGDTLRRTFKYVGSTVQNVQTLISCGPTVLKNGSIFTNYSSEGNYDSHVLGGGAHMLIGVKSNGRVVIASASGSQKTMGSIMKALGCTSAINVDGGASTYLTCNGKSLASPGRNLTNMLVFSKK